MALFAGIFEWYEFSIYGLLAAILGSVFFSSNYPIHSALSAFSLLAFTYLARPIGSLFFGVIGDRVGRGYALKISLVLMAVPTVLIGILPTYQQIGIYSTILLSILRLIQGFAVGGELTNSAVYVFDHSPSQTKTVLCSLVSASIGIGFLCGSAVVALLFWCFDRQAIIDWAWRIPFLLGIPLTLWIIVIRQSIQDSTSQLPMGHANKSLRNQLIAARRNFFKVFLLGGFGTICTYTFAIWMPFYLTHFIGVSDKLAYSLNMLITGAEIIFLVLAGYLARFMSYAKLYQFFYIALLFLAWPMFKGLETGGYSMLVVMHLLFALLHGGMDGNSITLVGQLMPTGVRSLGMSLNFTLASTLLGGVTPVILTYFTHKTGMLAFPAFYIIAFGLLALPVVLSLKSTQNP